jgi:hypothetical protein
MENNNVRIWSAVSPELNSTLDDWAFRLGMTKSSLINMAIQAGLASVIRAVAPEQVFTPKEWAGFVVEMMKTGKPVTLPDGSVLGSEEK